MILYMVIKTLDSRFAQEEEYAVVKQHVLSSHTSIEMISVHDSTHWYICFCVLAVAVAVVVITKVNAPDCLYKSGAIIAFTLIFYDLLNERTGR